MQQFTWRNWIVGVLLLVLTVFAALRFINEQVALEQAEQQQREREREAIERWQAPRE